jgi:hypothetical protein
MYQCAMAFGLVDSSVPSGPGERDLGISTGDVY